MSENMPYCDLDNPLDYLIFCISVNKAIRLGLLKGVKSVTFWYSISNFDFADFTDVTVPIKIHFNPTSWDRPDGTIPKAVDLECEITLLTISSKPSPTIP